MSELTGLAPTEFTRVDIANAGESLNCRACGGDGGYWDGDYPQGRWVTCRLCKGTGSRGVLRALPPAALLLQPKLSLVAHVAGDHAAPHSPMQEAA